MLVKCDPNESNFVSSIKLSLISKRFTYIIDINAIHVSAYIRKIYFLFSIIPGIYE